MAALLLRDWGFDLQHTGWTCKSIQTRQRWNMLEDNLTMKQIGLGHTNLILCFADCSSQKEDSVGRKNFKKEKCISFKIHQSHLKALRNPYWQRDS